MTKEQRTEVYNKITLVFSEREQIHKAVEELLELALALQKMDRVNITEEMADVKVMIEQLEMIFDNEKFVNEMMTRKVERTIERYNLNSIEIL